MAIGTTTALLALAAVQAGTQVASGMAQSKEAKYNAGLYSQQAGMIEQQKELEAYQYDRAKGRMAGTLTARVAKSGFTMSGSPMAVLLDNLTQMELDKSIGQYNLDVQKQQALETQKAYRRQAKSALVSGYANAFSTMLSAGAQYGMSSGSFAPQYANVGNMGNVRVAPANYYLR